MLSVLVPLLLVQCLISEINGQEELSLEGRNKACDVLVAIDESLFKEQDGNMTFLVNLAKDHIKGLNQIFANQVFVEQHESYFFNLKRVQVAFGTCESDLLDEKYDKNCTEQRTAYLNAFSRHDTSDFCLAYILTYLDFHNGTAGLANVGTVCRPANNTGFVTMLNFHQERGLHESVITLSHEVAHNFNASHDDVFEDNPECYNKGFIMDELLNTSSSNKEENERKFSSCSKNAMKAKLIDLMEVEDRNKCFRDVAYDGSFSELQVSLCGNEIVEEGEQCDCGMNQTLCNDPCCYPAFISSYERSLNSSAFPCQWNTRTKCLIRPGLKYGFYFPWAVILTFIVAFAFILHRDWNGKRRLFAHITDYPVIIVKSRS